MTTAAIAERYTLLREVGRGGMGAVWLGEDLLLHRQVALKRIGFAPAGPDGGVSDLVRAEREARLAAMINHPHVVAVYDLVEDDDRRWLVMEYVEGTALSQLVDDQGPLAVGRAGSMVAQAADALAAAHAAGIVHRDVKPSNMLVTATDQVKISDFGIAKSEEDASLTQTGMVTGSPAYLAPEVASGAGATASSDVWSLGATLYHAVSGRPPYAVTDNVLGTLYQIVNDPPPRLPAGHPLALLLEHTMATDPDRRWSMVQVRDFLRTGRAPGAPAHRRTAPPAPPPPRETTQVLPTPAGPAPAGSFLDETVREPAARPGPGGPTAPGGRAAQGAARGRDPRLLPAVVVAVAVVLVVVVGLGLALLGDDDSDGQTAGDGSSATTRDGGTSPPGSDAPSDGSTDGPTEGPTAEGMESFVSDYLSTVVSDPRAAWERLTPGFQDESDGYGGYRGFWSQYTGATPSNIQADPEDLTVSYTVEYAERGGGRVTDQTTLRLQYTDGSYLIAGEG